MKTSIGYQWTTPLTGKVKIKKIKNVDLSSGGATGGNGTATSSHYVGRNVGGIVTGNTTATDGDATGGLNNLNIGQ